MYYLFICLFNKTKCISFNFNQFINSFKIIIIYNIYIYIYTFKFFHYWPLKKYVCYGFMICKSFPWNLAHSVILN